MLHRITNSLRIGYFGIIGLLAGAVTSPLANGDVLPYAAYYNPDVGFKPAQRDFTKIFLQLAGSLEHHGTPELYIRHVMAEHERIEKKYKAATGKETTARPKYLTDQFVENLIGNWNKMNTGLKLETLSRDAGKNMRLAIMGTWNLSNPELLDLETEFTKDELALYAKFLAMPHFKKQSFPELESFYSDGGGWDRMTEIGRSQMTKRVAYGILPPGEREAKQQKDKGGSLVVKLLNTHTDELMHYLSTDSEKVVNGDTLFSSLKTGLKLDGDVPKLEGLDEYVRDAYQFSHAIKWEFDYRAKYIREKITSKSNAEQTIEALNAMVENLAVIANSEFRAGLADQKATRAND